MTKTKESRRGTIPLKRRLISGLLALTMVVSLLPGGLFPRAKAANITNNLGTLTIDSGGTFTVKFPGTFDGGLGGHYFVLMPDIRNKGNSAYRFPSVAMDPAQGEFNDLNAKVTTLETFTTTAASVMGLAWDNSLCITQENGAGSGTGGNTMGGIKYSFGADGLTITGSISALKDPASVYGNTYTANTSGSGIPYVAFLRSEQGGAATYGRATGEYTPSGLQVTPAEFVVNYDPTKTDKWDVSADGKPAVDHGSGSGDAWRSSNSAYVIFNLKNLGSETISIPRGYNSSGSSNASYRAISTDDGASSSFGGDKLSAIMDYSYGGQFFIGKDGTFIDMKGSTSNKSMYNISGGETVQLKIDFYAKGGLVTTGDAGKCVFNLKWIQSDGTFGTAIPLTVVLATNQWDPNPLKITHSVTYGYSAEEGTKTGTLTWKGGDGELTELPTKITLKDSTGLKQVEGTLTYTKKDGTVLNTDDKKALAADDEITVTFVPKEGAAVGKYTGDVIIKASNTEGKITVEFTVNAKEGPAKVIIKKDGVAWNDHTFNDNALTLVEQTGGGSGGPYGGEFAGTVGDVGHNVWTEDSKKLGNPDSDSNGKRSYDIYLNQGSGLQDTNVDIEVTYGTGGSQDLDFYTYTLTAGNGGTVSDATFTVATTTSEVFLKGKTIAPTATPNTGYTHEGWYEGTATPASGASKVDLDDYKPLSKKTELYAKFDLITPTLTPDTQSVSNGGTGTVTVSNLDDYKTTSTNSAADNNFTFTLYVQSGGSWVLYNSNGAPNKTGVFANLPAGSYKVRVTDSTYENTYKESNEVTITELGKATVTILVDGVGKNGIKVVATPSSGSAFNDTTATVGSKAGVATFDQLEADTTYTITLTDGATGWKTKTKVGEITSGSDITLNFYTITVDDSDSATVTKTETETIFQEGTEFTVSATKKSGYGGTLTWSAVSPTSPTPSAGTATDSIPSGGTAGTNGTTGAKGTANATAVISASYQANQVQVKIYYDGDPDRSGKAAVTSVTLKDTATSGTKQSDLTGTFATGASDKSVITITSTTGAPVVAGTQYEVYIGDKPTGIKVTAAESSTVNAANLYYYQIKLAAVTGGHTASVDYTKDASTAKVSKTAGANEQDITTLLINADASFNSLTFNTTTNAADNNTQWGWKAECNGTEINPKGTWSNGTGNGKGTADTTGSWVAPGGYTGNGPIVLDPNFTGNGNYTAEITVKLNGSPVEGATVVLESTAQTPGTNTAEHTQFALTDSTGKASVSGLQAKYTYGIRVEAPKKGTSDPPDVKYDAYMDPQDKLQSKGVNSTNNKYTLEFFSFSSASDANGSVSTTFNNVNYYIGTVITATAKPSNGYHFSKWTKDSASGATITGQTASYNIGTNGIQERTDIYANFVPNTVTITKNLNGVTDTVKSRTISLYTVPSSGSPTIWDSAKTQDTNAVFEFTVVPNGTYAVYDGGGDTGLRITVKDNDPTRIIQYYTVNYQLYNKLANGEYSAGATTTPASVEVISIASSGDVDAGRGTITLAGVKPAANYNHTGWTTTPDAARGTTAVTEKTTWKIKTGYTDNLARAIDSESDPHDEREGILLTPTFDSNGNYSATVTVLLDGAPVNGATVTLTPSTGANTPLTSENPGTTNGSGQAKFTELKGTYSVTVTGPSGKTFNMPSTKPTFSTSAGITLNFWTVTAKTDSATTKTSAGVAVGLTAPTATSGTNTADIIVYNNMTVYMAATPAKGYGGSVTWTAVGSADNGAASKTVTKTVDSIASYAPIELEWATKPGGTTSKLSFTYGDPVGTLTWRAAYKNVTPIAPDYNINYTVTSITRTDGGKSDDYTSYFDSTSNTPTSGTTTGTQGGINIKNSTATGKTVLPVGTYEITITARDGNNAGVNTITHTLTITVTPKELDNPTITVTQAPSGSSASDGIIKVTNTGAYTGLNVTYTLWKWDDSGKKWDKQTGATIDGNNEFTGLGVGKYRVEATLGDPDDDNYAWKTPKDDEPETGPSNEVNLTALGEPTISGTSGQYYEKNKTARSASASLTFTFSVGGWEKLSALTINGRTVSLTATGVTVNNSAKTVTITADYLDSINGKAMTNGPHTGIVEATFTSTGRDGSAKATASLDVQTTYIVTLDKNASDATAGSPTSLPKTMKTTDPATFDYGDTVEPKGKAPTRTGYTFAGWSTKESDIGRTTADWSSTDTTYTTVDSETDHNGWNSTVYAVWTAIKPGKPADIATAYGARNVTGIFGFSFTKAANTRYEVWNETTKAWVDTATGFAKSGITLKDANHGLAFDAASKPSVPTDNASVKVDFYIRAVSTVNNSASADDKVTGEGTVPNDATKVTVTVYPSYKVTYDANAGSDTVTGMPGTDAHTYVYVDDSTTKSFSGNKDNVVVGNIAPLASKPTRAGYDFKGWALVKTAASGTAAGGSIAISDALTAQGYQASTREDGVKSGGTFTIYATWEPQTIQGMTNKTAYGALNVVGIKDFVAPTATVGGSSDSITYEVWDPKANSNAGGWTSASTGVTKEGVTLAGGKTSLAFTATSAPTIKSTAVTTTATVIFHVRAVSTNGMKTSVADSAGGGAAPADAQTVTVTVYPSYTVGYSKNANPESLVSGTVPTDDNLYVCVNDNSGRTFAGSSNTAGKSAVKDNTIAVSSAGGLTWSGNAKDFGGWSLSRNGGTDYKGKNLGVSSAVTTQGVAVGETVTLYAIWTSDEYGVQDAELTAKYHQNASSSDVPGNSWIKNGLDLNTLVTGGGVMTYKVTGTTYTNPNQNGDNNPETINDSGDNPTHLPDWLELTSGGVLRLASGKRVGKVNVYTIEIEATNTSAAEGEDKVKTITVTLTVGKATPIIEGLEGREGVQFRTKDHLAGDPVADLSEFTYTRVKDPYLTNSETGYELDTPPTLPDKTQNGTWSAVDPTFKEGTHKYTFTYTPADTMNYTTAQAEDIEGVGSPREPYIKVKDDSATKITAGTLTGDTDYDAGYSKTLTVTYGDSPITATITVDLKNASATSPINKLTIAQDSTSTTGSGSPFSGMSFTPSESLSPELGTGEEKKGVVTFNIDTTDLAAGTYILKYNFTGYSGSGENEKTAPATYTFKLVVEKKKLSTPQPDLQTSTHDNGGLDVTFPPIGEESSVDPNPVLEYEVELKDKNGKTVGKKTIKPTDKDSDGKYHWHWDADGTDIVPGEDYTVEVTAKAKPDSNYANSDPGKDKDGAEEAGKWTLKPEDLVISFNDKTFNGGEQSGYVSVALAPGKKGSLGDEVKAIQITYTPKNDRTDAAAKQTHVNMTDQTDPGLTTDAPSPLHHDYYIWVYLPAGTYYKALEGAGTTGTPVLYGESHTSITGTRSQRALTHANWEIVQAMPTVTGTNITGATATVAQTLSAKVTYAYDTANSADIWNAAGQTKGDITRFYDLEYTVNTLDGKSAVSGTDYTLVGDQFTPLKAGTFNITVKAKYKTTGFPDSLGDTQYTQFKADLAEGTGTITVTSANAGFGGLTANYAYRRADYGDARSYLDNNTGEKYHKNEDGTEYYIPTDADLAKTMKLDDLEITLNWSAPKPPETVTALEWLTKGSGYTLTVKPRATNGVTGRLLANNTIQFDGAGSLDLVFSYNDGINQGSVTVEYTLYAKPLTYTVSEGEKIWDGAVSVPGVKPAKRPGVTLDAGQFFVTDTSLGTDTVSISATGFAYDNAAVSGHRTITASGVRLSGAQAGFYSVSATKTGDGAIKPAYVKSVNVAVNAPKATEQVSSGTYTPTVSARTDENNVGTGSWTLPVDNFHWEYWEESTGSWKTASGTFQVDTVYRVVVTLKADTNHYMSEGQKANYTINGKHDTEYCIEDFADWNNRDENKASVTVDETTPFHGDWPGEDVLYNNTATFVYVFHTFETPTLKFSDRKASWPNTPQTGDDHTPNSYVHHDEIVTEGDAGMTYLITVNASVKNIYGAQILLTNDELIQAGAVLKIAQGTPLNKENPEVTTPVRTGEDPMILLNGTGYDATKDLVIFELTVPSTITASPGLYHLELQAMGSTSLDNMKAGKVDVAKSYYTFTLEVKEKQREPEPQEPSERPVPVPGPTVIEELPVVTYWISDNGYTNDLTAEKIAKKGDRPSFVPKVTAKSGYIFKGWMETDPTLLKEGEVPKLVDPLTFAITEDKTFYAYYEPEPKEGVDHTHYVVGYSDGTFRPQNSITRAEVATIIARTCLEGFVEGSDYGNPGNFSDVGAKKWYASAIAYCTMFDVFAGYPDGTFRPDQPITRQELANVVARLAGVLVNQGMPFTDAGQISKWARDGVYTAYAKGWVQGDPDGSFRPQDPITRAETVAVFNGYLNRGVDAKGLEGLTPYMLDVTAGSYEGDGTTEYLTWSDVPAKHWAYHEILEASNDHDFHWPDDTETPPEDWDDVYLDEKWRYREEFTVTYDAGSLGTLRGTTSYVVAKNKTVKAAPGVTPADGYIFLGWSTTPNGTLVEPTSVVIQANTTFYAVYREVQPEFYMALFVAGEDGVLNGEALVRTQEKTTPAVPTVTANEGYIFLGWAETDPALGGAATLVDPAVIPITANKTYYAVYREVKPEPTPGTEEPQVYLHVAYFNGREEGIFDPKSALTRAEAAAMVVRGWATDYDPNTVYDTSSLSDVADHPYRNYIGYCMEHGIFSGYVDGTFKPDGHISRQEFALLLAHLGGVQTNQGLPFTDADSIKKWARDGIYTAYVNGWMKGYADGTFQATGEVTRAEAVTAFNNFLGRKVTREGIADVTEFDHTWTDVKTTNWAWLDIMEATHTHLHYLVDGVEYWLDATDVDPDQGR